MPSKKTKFLSLVICLFATSLAIQSTEKSAVAKKDKPTKGNKVADEGNAYGLAVKNTPAGEEIKINGKGTGDIKKESADLTRMKEFLTRLNG